MESFIKIILSPIAPFLALLISIIAKTANIKFGHLKVDRLGHFTIETEIFLCELENGFHGEKRPKIFLYYDQTPCNNLLLQKWESFFYILPFKIRFFSLAFLLEKAINIIRTFPMGNSAVITWPTHDDVNRLIPNTSTHLSFTREEKEKGKAFAIQVGLKDEFICFHNRDSKYLNEKIKNVDWKHHNYRDFSVKHMVQALEKLGEQGISSLRMGELVSEKLNVGNNHILDYASFYRTELLDLYLSANCKFFLVSNTGVNGLPKIFRRPLAIINMTPLFSFIYFNNIDLFIPKLVKNKQSQKILGFFESMSCFGYTFTNPKANVEVVENTADEITDLVMEMNERIDGRWKETQKSEALQSRFWDTVTKKEYKRPEGLRIGSRFLEKYEHLL